jgi:hypothetical protein
VEGGGTVSPAGDRKPFGDEVILLDLDTGVTARSPGSPERHLDLRVGDPLGRGDHDHLIRQLRLEPATLVLNKVDGSAEQRATERQFSRDRSLRG